MDLIEWNQKLKKEVEEGIDGFMEEYGDEYITPSSLEPIEIQRQRVKQELNQEFLESKYLDYVVEGFEIAFQELQEKLSIEDWEIIEKEIQNVPEAFLDYLEADNIDQGSGENQDYKPYEWLGLSEKFVDHCKDLMVSAYKDEDYDKTYRLSMLLVVLAPKRIEGWFGIGRYWDQKGEFYRAILIYEKIQHSFAPEPASYLLCADSCLSVGDMTQADVQLKEAEKILDNDEVMSEIWLEPLAKLKQKLEKMQKE